MKMSDGSITDLYWLYSSVADIVITFISAEASDKSELAAVIKAYSTQTFVHIGEQRMPCSSRNNETACR